MNKKILILLYMLILIIIPIASYIGITLFEMSCYITETVVQWLLIIELIGGLYICGKIHNYFGK